jgi:hypothetical protein
MKGYMFNKKPLTSALNLVAALLLVLAAVPASAAQQQDQQSPPSQQSPQQPQNAPPPSQQTSPASIKPHKVWSNEDVVSLRTPEDIYLVEKDAQEAAAAEASAKEAAADKLTKELGLTMTFPATPEETQQWIKAREQQMKEDQAVLERLNGELPQTPEDRKPDMQKEIDRVTNDLQKACVEIKLLQNHLQKMTKTPAAETSPALPSPPSS